MDSKLTWHWHFLLDLPAFLAPCSVFFFFLIFLAEAKKKYREELIILKLAIMVLYLLIDVFLVYLHTIKHITLPGTDQFQKS